MTELSKEIERIFEAKVKPNTLISKVQRESKKSDTNVSKESNNENKTITYEPDEKSQTHPPTQRGGTRPTAGRKPQEYNKVETELFGTMEGSEAFCSAFEVFYIQVQNAQLEKWNRKSS